MVEDSILNMKYTVDCTFFVVQMLIYAIRLFPIEVNNDQHLIMYIEDWDFKITNNQI